MSTQGTSTVAATGLRREVSSPEGRLTILDGVDLAVAAGETVAIVGASGSGKSTLLGLLAGLDRPTAGRVELAGTDITELGEDGRAAVRAGRVGFVFQAFHLLPALTARENVLLPMEVAGIADAGARADSTLERVGLTARAHHRPHQLSGGEQQRVAIARAFAPDPAVLFADEPTGNLDQATGERVVDLLFGINAEAGTTLILVTHDPALAARCDRRITLDAGRASEAA
ncbi:ABC transporter ATP-binding protein [Thiohalospira sp.]|uniref:ABC transporter ATP-binding protein n=1 Tax=Thiohalospira sp. TaxID=3080549 RepID=UPI00397F23F3